MQPHRGLKTNELITELSKLLEVRPEERDFTLKRVEREIETLRLHDLCMYYMLSGIIAAFRCNIDAVHSNFRRALKLTHEHSYIYLNYSMALKDRGFFNQAADYAIESFQRDPSDKERLREVLFLLCLSGRFHEAEQYITVAESLKLEGIEAYAQLLQAFQNTLLRYDIPAHAIVKLQDIVANHLLKNKISIMQRSRIVDVDPEYECITFEYALDVSPEKSDELQDELEELLWQADLFEIIEDYVSIKYCSQYTDESIEKKLNELEIEIKEFPERIISLDHDLMSEIRSLVEG